MSIVAYYAKLSEEDLEEVTSNPEILHSGKFQVIDIDRSWDPMTWLLSEFKRAEHSYNNLIIQRMIDKRNQENKKKGGFLSKVFSKKEESSTSEEMLLDAKQKIKDLQPDLILIGIEGRGKSRVGSEDFGLGEACLFAGDELREIVQTLNAIDIRSLKPDFMLMDSEDEFPVSWVEEGEDLFESYIISNFEKLKRFYTEAQSGNQCILVWYT